MKVILLTDVKKQGKKDDVINVSDGYANNFLIAKGLAVPYNTQNKNKLEKDLKIKKDKEEALIEECKKIKEKLEKVTINIKVKSGAQGKMFGSVSSKQIVMELNKLGFDIDKKKIDITNPIDTLGIYKVKINLHKKVIANITVHVE